MAEHDTDAPTPEEEFTGGEFPDFFEDDEVIEALCNTENPEHCDACE